MSGLMESNTTDRGAEWFVPKFGPAKFRSFIGLLFLPYTGMVLSFSVIGSTLGNPIYWERVLAIVVIYFFGLGISAHALDAVGSKGTKPWEPFLRDSNCASWPLFHWPLLTPLLFITLSDTFPFSCVWLSVKASLFSLTIWSGFMGDFIRINGLPSHGLLPVLAGYIMQTNKFLLRRWFWQYHGVFQPHRDKSLASLSRPQTSFEHTSG